MTEQNIFENTFDTILQNIELFNNSKSKIQIFFKKFMDSKYISLKNKDLISNMLYLAFLSMV